MPLQNQRKTAFLQTHRVEDCLCFRQKRITAMQYQMYNKPANEKYVVIKKNTKC